MKASPPPLLPLLRSRTQGELLTRLLLAPETELSLTDLARHLGVSVPTVLREVDRAEHAGVVTTRKVGNTRLARANAASPLVPSLTELLLRSFGPGQVIAEELDGLDGIDQVFLYGSWAARYLGTEGRAPKDIDVLVVGEPDRQRIYEAADRAERRLGRDVQVVVRSRASWERADEPLLLEVRRRPLVRVIPAAAPEPPA